MKPGAKRGLTSELTELPVNGEEDVLCQIFRVLSVTEKLQTEAPDVPPVTAEKLGEGAIIALTIFETPCNELLLRQLTQPPRGSRLFTH